ncbi:Flagellar biosynthesis protein FliL [hydrothermal vent metagenome]|uniref:Flagellar biosynthesis protein FliL n=1 Tax=hydrothermal vent metagenome TaxID=652676 RepID=A0A3B1D760_9ZZZZ
MGDEEVAGVEPAKGGGSKLIIILLVVVALLVIGGGAAAYFLVFSKGAEEEVAAKPEKEKTQDLTKMATLGSTMQMDPFVVNLAGNASRYLKVVIVLQLSVPELAEEITNRSPQIKDSILTVLSSKSADEILTVQGKYDLKVDLIRRINSNLTLGVVRELFFTEFVVQ